VNASADDDGPMRVPLLPLGTWLLGLGGREFGRGGPEFGRGGPFGFGGPFETVRSRPWWPRRQSSKAR